MDIYESMANSTYLVIAKYIHTYFVSIFIQIMLAFYDDSD